MPSEPQPAAPGEEPLPSPTPRVSVVIPAWNRRETLRMSVESVLRQTFTDFELIVVDDGSTDGTMEAIADIADPRIRRLAHETNKGVSAARNTGIRAARGEWVAFNDSDDEWLPLKLEKQMARLEGAGPEVVACYTGMLNTGSHEEPAPSGRTSTFYIPSPRQKFVEGDLFTEQVFRWFVPIQTIVARREEILRAGGFDADMKVHEDRDFTISLCRNRTFLFIDEPLVVRKLSRNSLALHQDKWLGSLVLFIQKWGADMAALCPGVLAHNYTIVSGHQRRLGDLPAARSSLAKARKLRPFSPGLWLRSLRLSGLVLWQRMKGM